jgi:hypothetical protein
MSTKLIDWGQILVMEDGIRHLVRLADVLTTIGCGSESLSPGACYVLGCTLHDLGAQLEEQYDAINPIRNGGPQ